MFARRFTILVLIVFGFAALQASVRGQERSWTGESVLPTRPSKEIDFGDRVGGKQANYSFSGRWPIKVRDEREGWIRIHDGRKEGWANKEQFVLVKDAPDYFNRRLQENPKDFFALYMRGNSWLEKRQYDKAIQDFDECIRLQRANSQPYNGRGVAYADKKDNKKAIEDYDEAIRLNPKYVVALHNRGIAWRNLKEYDKALQDFDESLRLDPQYVPAYNNRGVTWRLKNNFDKALDDFNEAIRLDPKGPAGFSNRGFIWYLKKDYAKAIHDLDEAIRFDPKNSIAFYNRARSHARAGRTEPALDDLEHAFQFGYRDVKQMSSERAFDALRKESRYEKLVEKYKK